MITLRKTGLVVGVVFLWLAALPLAAQTYKTMHLGMSNWHYGNTPKALNFNRVTTVPTVLNNKFTPFGTGGAATASNPANGNLLFYTDGESVFDAFNQIMPSSLGLAGNNTSNQPAAICPVPGQPNKYFIFTNTATNMAAGSISFSVVDMNAIGNTTFPSTVPSGDLEPILNRPITGLTGNRSEAMTIVPHSNGTEYWLISHEFDANNFTVTLINAAFYTGVTTSTVSVGVGLSMRASHFAAFGTRVAVASSSAGVDAIILTLTETTATNATFSVVPEITIANSAVGSSNNQAIYDIEWSGDGNYVYYSVFGDAGIPGNVFQYDFNNPTTTLVSALPSTVFRSYGLQLAPDSTMYHIYQVVSGGSFLLGRFNDPDSVASKVNYAALPIDNTNWASMQFPALLPVITPIITVSFTTAGTCQNAPTSFYPTVIPGADSLVWDFGDGGPTVNAWSPVYTYQNQGTFNATVTAFYQGQSQVSSPVPVNIAPFALQLQLVSDTTACTFEFPPPKGTSGPPPFSVKATVSGGTGTPTAIWSNGDTGLTLTPDSAGYYYVVVSDGSGCSTYAGVNVKEYQVQDQRSNVWYFGDKAGIDFNKTPALALNDGAMNAPEGCSAMSDRNGEIIFYTDGNNVYDQTHALIATGIGGNTASSQSALIVPVNGDETLYYIFTTEASSDYPTNTIYYSLFDLKQNSGLGAVVQSHVPLYNGATERLASNGNWLITHEYGNNSFRCYPISILGIGEPVITSIGSAHAFNNPISAEGYMKIGPNNMIAVPLSNPTVSNFIEVFDFDTNTGILSNFRSVDLQESTAQAYGIEFSGNKMFITLSGSPSFIREVYIDFQNNPVLIPPTVAANSGPFVQKLGAIQAGPDGQLYIAIDGSVTLGTFTVNPDTLLTSTVNFAGFALAAGTTSNLGLPNFVQSQGNAFGGPSMAVAGVCFGSPMDYSAIPTDPIDTFLWGFGDGATSNLDSGQHVYAAPGTYTVSLVINNRCLIHDGTPPFSFNQSVNIVAPPAPPTIPATTAICTNPVVLDADNTAMAGLTYLWSTTETTRQISVATIGSYTVTITNAAGCTSNGTTNLLDARPPVNLGPDRTLCQNIFTLPLDAQNPPPSFSHVWTLDGVANGNTFPTQAISTTTPGTDTYEVTVTNITTGCQTIETVTFTITESPVVNLVATNTSICGASDGQVGITIAALTQTTQPPNHTFSYTLTGPATNITAIQALPVITHTISGLRAGTYSVNVIDDVSGCGAFDSDGISDPSNTLNAPDLNTCSTSVINATTNANTVPVAGNFTYRVRDVTNAIVDNGTRNGAAFSTNLANALPAGSYVLEITKSGCITTDAVTINQDPLITFTTLPNVCTTPNQSITASSTTPGVSYSWSGPSTVGATTNPTVFINPGTGTFNYTVTAAAAGFCATPATVPVTVQVAATPTITPSDPCQTQVTLSAAPASGGFSYQWYRNGVLDLSLLGQQVTLTAADDGDQFQVELASATSGCAFLSTPAITASVVGPVTAGITSTPACDDGSAFTITATTSATAPTYTWFKDIGSGYSVIPTEISASTMQTDQGFYKVMVSQGPCNAEASIQLLKAPLPIGGLPDQVIICDDPENADPATDHYDLDPGSFVDYAWFVKQTEDGPEVSLNFTDQVYTADRKAFYYRVELTNTFGCKGSDYTEVLNDCLPKLYAPNAFRPASQVTENKAFAVKSFFITDESFKVFIFNRWGELVFQSDDRFFEWNGGRENNTGVPLPSGAYAYLIEYVSSYRPDEGVQQKRGGVVLLR